MSRAKILFLAKHVLACCAGILWLGARPRRAVHGAHHVFSRQR